MIQDRSLTSVLALLGESPAMRRVRTQIKVVAPHLRSALIVAPDGLIAEAAARALHASSGQASRPLRIATPGGLNEIADLNHQVFLQRMESTRTVHLYVPGIDQLTASAQRMLLSFLDDKSAPGARRCLLGSQSAEGRAPAKLDEGGELLRRLASVTLRIPSLAERAQDLPQIVAAAIGELAERSGTDAPPLEPASITLLEQQAWPGDLAELEVVLAEAVALAAGRPLTPILLQRILKLQGDPLSGTTRLTASGEDDTSLRLQDVIDRHVLVVLRSCQGNKVRAAETLGISRSTLYRMLEAPALERPPN